MGVCCVTGKSSRLNSYKSSSYHNQPSVTSHGHGGHDELKEWLTRRWESCPSDGDTPAGTPTGPSTGVKRKASDVLETPADSTDDVFTRTSSRGSGATGGGRKGSSSSSSGGKVSKNNILLASLLVTRASAEQPVVNTLSIGSMATVTPQSSLLRRASSQCWESVTCYFISRIPEEKEEVVEATDSLGTVCHLTETVRRILVLQQHNTPAHRKPYSCKTFVLFFLIFQPKTF